MIRRVFRGALAAWKSVQPWRLDTARTSKGSTGSIQSLLWVFQGRLFLFELVEKSHQVMTSGEFSAFGNDLCPDGNDLRTVMTLTY